MNNITFTMNNPAAKKAAAMSTSSFLYRGQDNKLNFTFTNNGLGEIPLVNGNTFTIDIPTDVLVSASTDQLNNDNWKLQNNPATTASSGYFRFILTPKEGNTITLPNNGSITIGFQGMEGGAAQNDTVNCSFDVDGPISNGAGEKLFVLDPPVVGNKNITTDILRPIIYINDQQQEVSNGSVYISPSNNQKISPPIANTIHLNLTYSGTNLVKNWPLNKPPTFIFSFSYANINRAEALTDAIKAGNPAYNADSSAWNINHQHQDNKVEVDQNTLWTPQPLNNQTSTPSWEVKANDTNQHLFTADQRKLDVHFDHVISVLQGENATAFIQWTAIPGYNDGVQVLNISKAIPQPKEYIWGFYGPDQQVVASVEYNTPISLSWNSFGAAQIQLIDLDNHQLITTIPVPVDSSVEPALFYCGGITPSSSAGADACNNLFVFKLIPPNITNHYTIQAIDALGNKLGGQSRTVTINLLDFPVAKLSSFKAVLKEIAEGEHCVEFNWQSTGASKGKLQIGSKWIDIPEADFKNSSYQLPITEAAPYLNEYTLEVEQPQNNTKAQRTVCLSLKPLTSLGMLAYGTLCSMVMSPDGERIFISVSGQGTLYHFSVDNPQPDQIVTTHMGGMFCAMFPAPNTHELFVAYQGGNIPNVKNAVKYLSAVNPPSTVSTFINTGDNFALGFGWNANDSTILTSVSLGPGQSGIGKIDPTTKTFTFLFPTGTDSPMFLTSNQEFMLQYVGAKNNFDNTTLVWRALSNPSKEQGRVAVPGSVDVALSLDEKWIFCATNSGLVGYSANEPGANKQQILIEGGALGLQNNPIGGQIWGYNSSGLFRFNAGSNAAPLQLPLSLEPQQSLLFSKSGTRLFISKFEYNKSQMTVDVYDLVYN